MDSHDDILIYDSDFSRNWGIFSCTLITAAYTRLQGAALVAVRHNLTFFTDGHKGRTLQAVYCGIIAIMDSHDDILICDANIFISLHKRRKGGRQDRLPPPT